MWKQTDSAHVFIAQKDNGVIKYLDPQTGILDVDYYFAYGKPSNFGFVGLMISHWQRIKKYSLLLQKESDLL